MSKNILLVATHAGIGLTSTVMGVYHALDRKGVKVSFFKPILQYAGNSLLDNSYELMRRFQRGHKTEMLSISPHELQQAMDSGHLDELMENVLAHHERATGDADIVLMEGLLETATAPYASVINQKVARALDADVILVGSARVENEARLRHQLDYLGAEFGGVQGGRLLGAIVNHCDSSGAITCSGVAKSTIFTPQFPLLGAIPFSPEIGAPRVSDLATHLGAQLIFAGDCDTRRVKDFVMFARSVPYASQFFRPGNCIFCPGDRDDALMSVTISAASGTQLACLVMMGPEEPSTTVFELCRPLLQKSGLPVLHINSSSWGVVEKMRSFNLTIAADDDVRMQKTQEYVAEHLSSDWVTQYLADIREATLSPAAFRYQIVKQAVAAKKTIVLPEGDEPRTVAAVAQISARQMAQCVLLASPDKVAEVAQRQGVKLGANVRIIEPSSVREKYVARIVELRAHKGMNETLAREQLEDNVMLGTMMLEAGEVDGLVSGAVHTTANTMRPPLQIIKTAPGTKVVSSVFFMCLPDRVMVYGDCAIVPQPDAETLAQIAIQSHDTAQAFGIAPKVAMISYSTGNSGKGEDVEKVKAATALVREWRPDIAVDGPLQYDAASVPSVATKKAPDSPVAGKATVFIFPDLNTGNTTYKAVQRSANAISMGPVLQGMKKPVNDLSRGALVDDIVYTIAITAVQAAQLEKPNE